MIENRLGLESEEEEEQIDVRIEDHVQGQVQCLGYGLESCRRRA